MAASAVVWLFAIDPLWRALTPRSFAGIPAPQLMAVLVAFPLIWIAVMALWARALGPGARGFLRARCYEWKRWLAVAFAALVVANQQG